MRKVTSIADVPRTEYEPLILEASTGEIVTDLEERAIRAEVEHSVLTAIHQEMSGIDPSPIEALAMVQQRLDAALIELTEARKELEDGDYIQYNVRGMPPYQAMLTQHGMLSMPKPKPPIKRRQTNPPLDNNGRMMPERGPGEESYVDMEDPAYLKQMKMWELDQTYLEERITAHILMCCVKGLELTDEQIKDKLGEDAHPKEPVENYRHRLDQAVKILLTAIDGRHLVSIMDRVNQLSGVRADRINFTSPSTFPLS